MKILITEAIKMPIRPINMKLPIPVKSFFVTQPKILKPANANAQVKKVEAINAPVYILKI